jgi:hypothetical protein
MLRGAICVLAIEAVLALVGIVSGPYLLHPAKPRRRTATYKEGSKLVFIASIFRVASFAFRFEI